MALRNVNVNGIDSWGSVHLPKRKRDASAQEHQERVSHQNSVQPFARSRLPRKLTIDIL